MKKLPLSFFYNQPIVVAKSLLGKILVTNVNGITTGGKIVEVECYSGFDDPANHGARGLTERNRIIFEKGGVVYVYLNYGVHCLLNIVVGEKDYPASVFIRAIEPMIGIEEMKKRRNVNDIKNLTNGPAKLTKALGIDKSFYGERLDGDRISIFSPDKKENFEIVETTRIGISKGKDLLRRFYIKSNPFVSKP